MYLAVIIAGWLAPSSALADVNPQTICARFFNNPAPRSELESWKKASNHDVVSIANSAEQKFKDSIGNCQSTDPKVLSPENLDKARDACVDACANTPVSSKVTVETRCPIACDYLRAALLGYSEGSNEAYNSCIGVGGPAAPKPVIRLVPRAE